MFAKLCSAGRSTATKALSQHRAFSAKVGDALPAATLHQKTSEGPTPFDVTSMAKGKNVVIFQTPGAFTPTCENEHIPSFVKAADALKAKGVDEVWHVTVRRSIVMLCCCVVVVRRCFDGHCNKAISCCA
jgi:hypothetical protein